MSDSPTFRHRASGGSNNNITSGYMPMEDNYYQHSGVRGGRSCCLCFVITAILFVAVINALVTAGLLYFLSITHEGMSAVEFLDREDSVRVLSDIDMEELVLHDSVVGLRGDDVMITGYVVVDQGEESKLKIHGNKTVLNGEQFELQTSSGKSLFSTSTALNLDLYQVKNLQAPAVDVGSVTSRDKYPDLHIDSFHNLDIVGAEGVELVSDIDTKLQAGKDLHIGVLGNTLAVNSDSVFLSTGLPLEGKQVTLTENSAHYKICVCGNTGKLFAVRETGVEDACHYGNGGTHPCINS